MLHSKAPPIREAGRFDKRHRVGVRCDPCRVRCCNEYLVGRYPVWALGKTFVVLIPHLNSRCCSGLAAEKGMLGNDGLFGHGGGSPPVLDYERSLKSFGCSEDLQCQSS